MKQTITPLKGTRDFYPKEMAIRNWLYNQLRTASESFGYQEYEAPFLEPLELYAAKSGEELVKEQAFVFPDRGGNLITLRPELTPSLARMIAQRQKQFIYPLRWWSFGPFWRYERPQKGRTREFFQWNVDIIGAGTPEADAEIVAIAATFFRNLGLSPQQVVILVNDRLLIEEELIALGITPAEKLNMFHFIDRRDKLEPAAWREYGITQGLSQTQLFKLESLLDDSNLWRKSPQLNRFNNAAQALGVSEYIRYAPDIVRGLDYYTGIVFEAQEQQGNIRRAILGGGRYDNLLSDVGGEPLPATGFAMGDVVLTLILDELNLLPTELDRSPAAIFVTTFDADYQIASLRLAKELRQAGMRVVCHLYPDKLSKQFRCADRIGTDIVIVLGPEELAQEAVTIKTLSTKQQKTIPRQSIIQTLQKILEVKPSS